MWSHFVKEYLQRHCLARGLRITTIASYQACLRQFAAYVEVRLQNKPYWAITTAEVLGYLQYLRQERRNSDTAVNRHLVILKCFYRALVAMDHLHPDGNPIRHCPTIKAAPLKLPVHLTYAEVKRLLKAPPGDTVLAVRDRTLLTLLYSTGIRASECAGINEGDFDWEQGRLTVTGKGGHQRSVPLNDTVLSALKTYRQVRGPAEPETPFFLNLRHKRMSRGAIYERVRKWSAAAGIDKKMSPHRLRHTFATHLIHSGCKLVTLRDMLGHKQISSTQIYLHVTAEHLREAAQKHPIAQLALDVQQLLPGIKLPWQHPPVRRLQTG